MSQTLHGQEHEAGGRDEVTGGSGAPTTADYLVGTAQGGLSAEIVVGTTPGGELGNTWASPTVDATHSGSTHAGAASAAVTTHEGAADPHTGYLKESDFDDVDFLVGTATGHTAAEIVVGTAPGGELGGTWASPTVDATHSGSTHAASTTTHEAASDPHPGYVLESLLDAKGDLIAASADNTPAKLTAGANDTFLMADSTQAAGLRWTNTAADVSNFPHGALPTGALREVAPRWLNYTNTNLLSTARLTVVAIMLPKGMTVTSISFLSATTAVSVGVNQWFALFDSSRGKLEVTSDDTSTAWAANTVKTLNLASPFVTTYAGLHYLGILVKATTVPTLACSTVALAKDLVPKIVGSCDTGLTNPASCPSTFSNFPTGSGVIPYAFVS